ncbi:MAG: sodium-translocating pyrophosphatase [Verrucomicrobia bacterium]|nr:sodium-translocating pyrophosphatase [Verrucomicrobiota bacterium]
MSEFLTQNGIILSIFLAALGLGYAIFLIKKITSSSPGNDAMQRVAAAIQDGAKAYLSRQVSTVSVIAVIMTVLLFIWKRNTDHPFAVPSGFLIGAVCSMIAGYIGMRIAVVANVRTTQAATIGATPALRVAFNGGAVTGLLVVGLALLAVAGFYLVMGQEKSIDSLVGLALGASLISVFARLGGGIYTKAADVGADLVGKLEHALDEDDPRNPATIADNVGDNVGDCAGMAADVFETYAVTLIGALLIASLTLKGVGAALVYPFLIGGISIIGAVLGILYINVRDGSPTALLMKGVGISAAVSAILFYPATKLLLPAVLTTVDGRTFSSMNVFWATIIGLVMTWAVVIITNYYTATQYAPVRKIAKASETGHATNIIAGIALGNYATALPVILICCAIAGGYSLAGLYGVAIAVMSMLSMAGIIVSLDAFGPITDNAGGIAVMSKLDKNVRDITDGLDAVGNTMKAVTKGYAIASAGVAALVLFGSYYLELDKHLHITGKLEKLASVDFSLKDPKVIIGLFLGGLLPFLFSAMSMKAVGSAAGAVVREVRRQITAKPGILNGTDVPEYATCVDIVTKAALREMIVPALLPLAGVLIVGCIPGLGYTALGGMLMGTIITGLFLGLSMTSAGGAWDNAKKYIEEGNHGGKGSIAHQAAVTGDTVGDPYKDTSGPAINPMIKVVNILAILVIELLF